jgi:hypothetical protein
MAASYKFLCFLIAKQKALASVVKWLIQAIKIRPKRLVLRIIKFAGYNRYTFIFA